MYGDLMASLFFGRLKKVGYKMKLLKEKIRKHDIR